MICFGSLVSKEGRVPAKAVTQRRGDGTWVANMAHFLYSKWSGFNREETNSLKAFRVIRFYFWEVNFY